MSELLVSVLLRWETREVAEILSYDTTCTSFEALCGLKG